MQFNNLSPNPKLEGVYTMKRFVLLIVFALSFVLAGLALAQDIPGFLGDNDPRYNMDANSCYEGGAFEGLCGDNPNMWRAGWYHIRLEFGMINAGQLPADVRWVSRPNCNWGTDRYGNPLGMEWQDRCVPTGVAWWR